MPDDPSSPDGAPAHLHRASSSGVNVAAGAPPGNTLRRSLTVDETRRRPPLTQSASGDVPLSANPRRRSSNFTDLSFGEARDILNPQAKGDADFEPPESSSLASLSLAFALLPALAGVLFKNGGAVVTDLMLLGLSGVFLHWSVTQPWNWYHAAQEVRVRQESSFESAIEEDSDFEGSIGAPPPPPRSEVQLGDVPEEEEGGDTSSQRPKKKPQEPSRSMSSEQRSAIRELYFFESMALVACFIFPLLAAYLLHTIRGQLSRPSEGLVSNYNLSIFCMASELRVFSHMFKLLQSRTLHLQRVVHRSPYAASPNVSASLLNDISDRLDRLENPTSRIRDGDGSSDGPGESSAAHTADQWKQEAALVQQVRSGIQPDLDALRRAVRRYEKKSTLLQMQVESRFGAVDARIDDSIALATSTAHSGASQRGLLMWLVDVVMTAMLLPFRAVLQILLLPLKTVSGLLQRTAGRRVSPAVSPSAQPGPDPRTRSQPRYSGDRVPSRVARR